MKFRSLAVVPVLVMVTSVAQAEDVPQFPGAEQEHQWLQQFVGDWSTHSKMETGPGVPAMECKGSISSRMIGALWVVNEMKAEVAGTQMVGIQTVGYDPDKKKYVGTWVDSMLNHMWHYAGTVDATGKILTLEAEGPNFSAGGKLTKFQDIYEFKSADEIAVFSKMLGEDGKWITFMTGTAKRQKPGQ